ncbi:MAG: hypothetical protein M3R36_18280 [Bacteroidota bacterium]|nr:hypothetical protein [Bacteroidota bacterium]
MKKLIYIFLSFFFLGLNYSVSQVPFYTLSIENLQIVSANSLEFEIRLKNYNDEVPFEYAGGQYYIKFDNNIANGGTLTYTMLGTQLPTALRPRNPSVGIAQDPSSAILKLMLNPLPGAGNGYNMPVDWATGTLIAKMRLTTSASTLNSYLSALQWRNPPIVTFATKILAYVGSTLTDITNPANHQDHGGIYTGSISVTVNVLFEGLYNPQTFMLNRKDSLTIYLRDAAAPYTLRDSSKRAIDSANRFATFHFYNATTGSYYMVLKHFNSLETWTRDGGVFLDESVVAYSFDFFNTYTWAYGQNVKRVVNAPPFDPVYCIYSGDVNQDGTIDLNDISEIDNNTYSFAAGRFIPADLNGDNLVDVSDLLIAENNAINSVSIERP